MPTPIRHIELAGPECAGNRAQLLTRVAMARGAKSVREVRSFLEPTPPLPNPWSDYRNLVDEAGDRIGNAVRLGQRILVFADYDVDGITSLVQFVRFLRLLQADCVWYIPDRLTESYGLTPAAAQRCFETYRPDLIITLDCGSSAGKSLEYLAGKGCDAIVVDHHASTGPIWDGVLHLNPHSLPGSPTALRRMSAAGLTFHLLQRWVELDGASLPQVDQDRFILLAGLGTLVDVMPLTGPNRALVKRSLALANSARMRVALPGLAAILRGHDRVTAWTYAFHVGPILNAAGRIRDADTSAELLLADTAEAAGPLATSALAINRERQEEQVRILNEALADAHATVLRKPNTRAIVVGREHWHTGIVGIVASKLRERFCRPCFVCGRSTTTPGEWKGSGRSIPGFDLEKAVSEAVRRKLLVAGGGHALAAGIQISTQNLDAFEAFLDEEAATLPPSAFWPHYETLPASGQMLEREWAELFSALEPFGAGHPRPLVRIARARLTAPPRILSDCPRPNAYPLVILDLVDVDTQQLYRVRAGLPWEALPKWNAGSPPCFSALLTLRIASSSPEKGSRQSHEWWLKATV